MAQTRSAADGNRIEPKNNRSPSCVPPLSFDLLGIDSIKQELQKLSAANQELLKAFQERAELPPAKPKDFGSSGNVLLPADADELARLKKQSDQSKQEAEQFKAENEHLRQRIAVLEARAKADAPTALLEQQHEFEKMLDEKTETIRELHMRIHELQDAIRGGPHALSRDQLEMRQGELDRLEQRLRADEDSLNRQAREMEMAMAKERAELARQRAELQRHHTDVQREIEMASRDPGLRERLMSLQRRPDARPRSSNSLADSNLGNAAPPNAPMRRPATMAAIDLDAEANGAAPQKTGILRRLFGG
jgi:hypothetical protein